MSAIASNLSRITGRLVVDRTGMVGRYDFKLNWMPEDPRFRSLPRSNPKAPPLLTAVEKQLGLKLESATGPVQILVVDRAERPAGN